MFLQFRERNRTESNRQGSVSGSPDPLKWGYFFTHQFILSAARLSLFLLCRQASLSYHYRRLLRRRRRRSYSDGRTQHLIYLPNQAPGTTTKNQASSGLLIFQRFNKDGSLQSRCEYL
ncbi:unnamed protein product [Citrullus colocynthis]|uniref:Uncharacterized protein n=1 Tax=Citrullus colocynthis TaxID=252529 RepID=A0ABP0XP59_9ROSI